MSHNRDAEICQPADFDFSQIKQAILSYQGRTDNWPLYLVSFYLFFSHLVNNERLKEEQTLPYPISSNRYNRYGWNANYQHCYTQEDIALMHRIHAAYQALIQENSAAYFDLQDEKRWYDWWQCTQPAYQELLRKLDTDSFTLPTRGTKDEKHFPLWNTAEDMARQIANWQGERIKGQPQARKNDPVMLVFEEFRDWFFTDLAQTECKKEALDNLAKRLSYIKHLIHLIPNFGPDRLHLLEIQHGLEDSSKILTTCLANKDLSRFLTDISNSEKDLEMAIGTYLHFFPDQEVADNFSHDYLEGGKRNCQASPLCTVYQAALKQNHHTDSRLPRQQSLSKFYNLVKVEENKDNIHLQMQLKSNLLDTIQFASFVSKRDKINYLEAIATLDAMVNTRKTLEQFHNIQLKLGSYLFSVQYLEKVNQLTSHYIRLINKNKLLIKSLIKTSDEGLKSILLRQNGQSSHNRHFEKNLRTLETRVAEKTTIEKQLELYCINAVESITNYQRATQQLASDVRSGQANRELENAMNDLLVQMNYMNTLLPAVLGEPQLMISPHSDMLVICDSTDEKACTMRLLPKTAGTDHLVALAVTNSSDIAADINGYERDNLKSLSHRLLEEASKQTGVICSAPDSGDHGRYIPFTHGAWDKAVKKDRHTHVDIFTYHLYDGETEVGSADFYGSKFLCQTEAGNHNIIQTTGILNEFHITPEMSIDEICQILPPTLFDRIWYTASESAVNGFLRGAANVIGVTLQSRGCSKQTADTVSQLSYYSSIFSLRFVDYYKHSEEYEDSSACLNALYYAAVDTGIMFLTSFALGQLTRLIHLAGDYLEKQYNTLLGSAVKKAGSLLRFGVYAQHAIEHGPAEAAAAVLSGMTVEMATEKLGNYALSLT